MKITVVGAGFVGTTTAQRLVERNLGDVVLHDVLPGIPQGKALDIAESACLEGFSSPIMGTNDPADYAGSGIVVVTSGQARTPGMSRDDLLVKNAGIIKEVALNVKKHAPDAIVIVITNPLDVMTHWVSQHTGFPAHRVIGMAGALDSARFRAFIAMELGVAHRDVQAMVLGRHGDDMIPLVGHATVGGVSIQSLLPSDKIRGIVQRTRNGGAEIVKLLQTGSAYYAPSSAAVQMVQAIVRDEKRLLPCTAWCAGHYGIADQFVGLPVILGKGGVERVVQVDLTVEETRQLQESARHIAQEYAQLQAL
jgi:malate dehydrogenase